MRYQKFNFVPLKNINYAFEIKLWRLKRHLLKKYLFLSVGVFMTAKFNSLVSIEVSS